MNELIIASKNKGKIEEFRQLFAQYGIQTYGIEEIDESIADVKETGMTFAENAQLKAETIAALLNKPVLADDSGLEVDALEKRPGVFSARYAGEKKDDKANMDKVLLELEQVDHRTARFVCVLALAIPSQETILERGTCEGSIARQPQGANGFGYDPIFVPNGYNQTMAQLTSGEKNAISHRHNALMKIEQTIQLMV
ncbi:XTP/dITP diphosphatase [Pontibacillus litoralis]|uniref:dITP/XTP pyrophosphatase n=1 Tax=Pontibacillus litoralis JSM 072002 TaxID=1385512 RepID=A0A0A5GD63_9BACI|nr:XTP/dITP diphosphatase [Pontibacillus litoralis]KGX89035.1 deoxyribonucleotide triphosphate pyrophosphatase [Pontibacillus litoralis JSM 072002]